MTGRGKRDVIVKDHRPHSLIRGGQLEKKQGEDAPSLWDAKVKQDKEELACTK